MYYTGNMRYLADALLVTGAGAVSYGAWVWFEPAGFITGGSLLLLAGLATARAEAVKGKIK